MPFPPGVLQADRILPGRPSWNTPGRYIRPASLEYSRRTGSFLEFSRHVKSEKSERMRDDIRPAEQLCSRKIAGRILNTESFQEIPRKDPVFRSPQNHVPTLFCRNGPCQPGNFLEGSRKFPGSFQEGSRRTRWIPWKLDFSARRSLPGSFQEDRAEGSFQEGCWTEGLRKESSSILPGKRLRNLPFAWKFPGSSPAGRPDPDIRIRIF